jgi:hypothetical protein
MQSSAVRKQHQGVLAVLLSPAILALTQGYALALQALLLPKRMVVTCLYLFNSGSGDLLAYLTQQPTSKMQVRGIGGPVGAHARRRAHAKKRSAQKQLAPLKRLRAGNHSRPQQPSSTCTPAPTHKTRPAPATQNAQMERQRAALSTAQKRLSTSQRLVEDLQREVEMLRGDRRKLQRRTAEVIGGAAL